MKRGDKTRATLIGATADLIQRQGFGATGMKEILAVAGASRSSLYFHFPGGKDELVVAALAEATRRWREELRTVLDKNEDPGECLQAACAALGHRLKTSGWHEGCPVATITLERASENEETRAVCEEHFRIWESFLTEVIQRALPKERAKPWATLALSSLEGGLLLARAYQNTAPLRRVGEELTTLLRLEMASAPR